MELPFSGQVIYLSFENLTVFNVAEHYSTLLNIIWHDLALLIQLSSISMIYVQYKLPFIHLNMKNKALEELWTGLAT